uniref:C2H2-type domain-containing protein n=1 Tax=Tetranychus urticae TaxID=32264 RepID=T1KG16_TETUR
MYIVKNSPVTSQANPSKPGTEPLNQSFILLTTTNPTVDPVSTSATKPFTNIITTGPPNANAPPLKYILIPSQKTVQNPNTGQQANLSLNTGVKTITFNTMPSGAPNVNLPAGTNLVPLNSRSMIKPMGKPAPTKVTAPITSPNKINFIVPPTQFAPTVQTPFAITNAPNKVPVVENPTISSTNAEQTTPTIESKSPKNLQVINNQVSNNPTSKSDTGQMKTLITYSKRSPTLLIDSTQQQLISGSEKNDSVSHPASNLSGKSANKKPMQFSNVPSVNATTPTTPTRRRKADLSEKGSILAVKKSKDDNQTNSDQCTIEENKSTDGVTKVRKVIASRNIQTSDKAIINTAAHELKKLLARRELLLKQLSSSCISLGKVEYKLTIAGSPINIQEMYSRIASFQKQFEEDLKRLDWAVSAMHKLYSELAPKDEMRSTEEILKDLMEPAEGVPEDPRSKYDRFRASPTKSISRSRPRVKTPRKPLKKYYYEGEEGCPESSFEDRVIPDKDPNDGKFHCELCSKVFLKQISLAKHLEFDHPVSLGLEKKLGVSRSRSPKRAHCCTDCDKSFHSNIMLLIHRSNEHDANDSYELSRESRTYSRRTLSDYKSKLNDEQETKVTNETSNKANRYGRAKRRTLMNDNKKPEKCDDDIFLPSSMMDHSNSSSVRSFWRDADLFDPDIPIECSADNPIILLKPLSKEIIDAYVKR